MLLTRADGIVASSDQEATQAVQAGYQKCATMRRTSRGGKDYGTPCPFYLSPSAQSMVTNNGGYYTCPVCYHSHDLLHTMPWHGADPELAEQAAEYDREKLGYFTAGGGTRIGLPMDVQASIGENLVRNLPELPGYGPVTWWHEGGSTGNSPLDGATAEWGIEVKTIGYDAEHHRYIPGGRRRRADGSTLDEIGEKNQMAHEMGKKGILGVLVLLDYNDQGGIAKGTKAFRSNQGMHLIKEIPFRNPLMDPHDPSPVVNRSGNGDSAFAGQGTPVEDEIPF
jgi:hypothetical protein